MVWSTTLIKESVSTVLAMHPSSMASNVQHVQAINISMRHNVYVLVALSVGSITLRLDNANVLLVSSLLEVIASSATILNISIWTRSDASAALLTRYTV